MGVKPLSGLASQETGLVEEVNPVKVPSKHGLWGWAKVQKLWERSEHVTLSQRSLTPEVAPQRAESQRPAARPVEIGLPRRTTFKRQNSERRERLLPVQQCPAERRAVSASRHTSLVATKRRSTSSPPPMTPARVSAPAMQQRSVIDEYPKQTGEISQTFEPDRDSVSNHGGDEEERFRPPRPRSRTSSDDSFDDKLDHADEQAQLNAELDSKWILNLSMYFRDRSDREKFFVTYAEQPNLWRRVTVSCDYRNAEYDSLEMNVKELQFHRDKSMLIYQSIRETLPDIQFRNTVTNLKLETRDGRLHVHVTEDENEYIPYPQRRTVSHILENSDSPNPPLEVRECELDFDSHLSGFVYKVKYRGKDYIKKEIPGPDTVDAFLYEANALHDLHDTDYVIRLEAIVVDDSRELVKGLLVSYAERGALVDLLYDYKDKLPWEDRVRWAEQAVRGLSQIHEEGYVQGDFTLSNIVVDEANDAKIIDINRRGCPVGWEPPEITKKIASHHRCTMYIGEKTDIFQLGMCLWALAMGEDEPERCASPPSVDDFSDEVPAWYRNIVRICLAPKPRERLSARELVGHFPPIEAQQSSVMSEARPSLSVRTNSKQYIDPKTAVEREDIQRYCSDSLDEEDWAWTPSSSHNNRSYTYPRSSNYEAESGSSYLERRRGRSPPASWIHGDRGTFERPQSLGEDVSPLEHDDRRLHIVTPLADHDYYDYVAEVHTEPLLEAHVDPERGVSTSSNNLRGEEHVQCQNYTMPLSENDQFPRALDDIGLEPPAPPNSTSLTSESTPRNAQSIMGASTATLPPALQLDLAIADLAGFRGHSEAGKHSPYEPVEAGRPPDEGVFSVPAALPPHHVEGEGHEKSALNEQSREPACEAHEVDKISNLEEPSEEYDCNGDQRPVDNQIPVFEVAEVSPSPPSQEQHDAAADMFNTTTLPSPKTHEACSHDDDGHQTPPPQDRPQELADIHSATYMT